MIDLDTTRALRSARQLEQLVRAILAASSLDESLSIEWKEGFDDLTSSEASFAIARAILGFANRPVAISKRSFEGVGYLVIGADPVKGLVDQVSRDSAEVTAAVHRYTGTGRPDWNYQAVRVDGAQVLVVIVEAPQDGDRIAMLQKSYQPPGGRLVPEGTIFVRRVGATERASRAEIEGLQDRLIAGHRGVSALDLSRTTARELVAGIVESGRAWVVTMQGIAMVSAKQRFSQRDWAEWVSTDSGREAAAAMKLVAGNTSRLRMSESDEFLLIWLARLEEALNDGAGLDALHGNGPLPQDERYAVYDKLSTIKGLLSALEARAIELYVG